MDRALPACNDGLAVVRGLVASTYQRNEKPDGLASGFFVRFSCRAASLFGCTRSDWGRLNLSDGEVVRHRANTWLHTKNVGRAPFRSSSRHGACQSQLTGLPGNDADTPQSWIDLADSRHTAGDLREALGD